MAVYVGEAVSAFYRWLGHREASEVLILDPAFRPGREHRAWNRDHRTYPITRYVRSEAQLLNLVRQYAGGKLIAIGHNERPRAFTNEHGFPRSAKEPEIRTSRQLFCDVDVEGEGKSPTQHRALGDYLRTELNRYFRDLGFQEPVITSSGKGYHVWVAHKAVRVEDHPDIAVRQKRFVSNLGDDHKDGLSRLEAKVDASVCDLRRVVKLPGTAKPGYRRLAEWPEGIQRTEDPAALDYLLNITIDDPKPVSSAMTPAFGPRLVAANGQLPELFVNLLRHDERLQNLWHGRGKTNGDASNSGYDFSLTRRLLSLGYRNIDDLATVLAARPEGAVKQGGRGEDYIRRTIANALLK